MRFRKGHIPWHKGKHWSENVRDKMRQSALRRAPDSVQTRLNKSLSVLNRPLGYNRTYSLDDNFFEEINNEAKAYFLGLMYADGCLWGGPEKKRYMINLGLEKTDKAVVETFKKVLSSTRPLYRITSRGYSLTESICLSVSSKKLFNDLINLGCTPKKTFTLKFPSFLPQENLHHFVRGYYDGDGWVSSTKGNLMTGLGGTYDFLSGLQNRLNFANGRIGRDRSIFRLVYSCSQANIFLDWIYQNATILMRRKRTKFDKLRWKPSRIAVA